LRLLRHLAYGDRGHHDGDGDCAMNGSLNQNQNLNRLTRLPLLVQLRLHLP
jgi:hypothetical protein